MTPKSVSHEGAASGRDTPGGNTAAGLPAKTLEPKAGRAASKPLYFGKHLLQNQPPTSTVPKDFALRAACTFTPFTKYLNT
jgi:hypothetical protein